MRKGRLTYQVNELVDRSEDPPKESFEHLAEPFEDTKNREAIFGKDQRDATLFVQHVVNRTNRDIPNLLNDRTYDEEEEEEEEERGRGGGGGGGGTGACSG